MPGNWIPNVRHVQDGELVDAAVTSRPDRDNENKINYLRERLDATNQGQANIASYVSASASVVEGAPVFFNTLTDRFEPALAGVMTDPASGTLVLLPSADCLGVCLYKHESTLIDVLLNGSAKVDLSAVVSGTVTPGRYFLSSAAPGMLVQQSPSVSVPVLFYDSDGFAYVNPLTRNFLTDHWHWKFDLACVPAGTTAPPLSGQRHVITAPDATQKGWLPAAHPVFNGLAPTAAAWGYNLSQHPQLNRVWPPIPVESAVLFWNRGDGNGASLVPTGLNGGLVVLDQNGIWFCSDCYGQVPWPTNYNSASPPPPPPADTSPPTCPFPNYMSMVLSYSVNLFATKSSVVTRLHSTSPLLTLVDPDGNPATTGDLAATVNLNMAVSATPVTGSTVLKTFVNGILNPGPVTEGLYIGSGLLASATVTDTTDPAHTLYQGRITLDLAPTSGALEIAPSIVRLQDVAEDTYQGIAFYRFTADRSSAMFLEYWLPAIGLASSPTLTLRVLLFGTSSGTIPNLTVLYRLLSRPGTGVQIPLPAVDTSLSFTTGQSATPYAYFEVSSASIPVVTGQTVLVTIQRNAADGFSGDLGLLRPGGILGGT